MKTNGQLLYEHKHPATIRVVLADERAFATKDDVFEVPNPAAPVAWRFLTESCRKSWETSAVGHYLFSKAQQLQRSNE
jgi:hypothetical protein